MKRLTIDLFDDSGDRMLECYHGDTESVNKKQSGVSIGLG